MGKLLELDRDNIHGRQSSMWGIFACHNANHFLRSGLFSIYQSTA